MAGKIVRLSEEVINRIAAGEVVENPATLLKELIENSLDAGADRISIWIEEGGEKLIRIEDNGCGMNEEDAVLSLDRYATSKIKSEKDLETLATMGFRGEALAAIASVSKLDLKTSDGFTATHIQVEGGLKNGLLPCARNKGTSIEVRSLFYNVPARKKFLKTAGNASILKVVQVAAMAYPEVAFFLYAENEPLMELLPKVRKKRIEEILGEFAYTYEEGPVWALFSAPDSAKLQKRGQYLFVNQRPVVSPLISKAVKMGYGTRIGEVYHPPFVLFLTLPSDSVDINVHPQKKEVRFADDGKIYRMVEKAVAGSFEEAPMFTKTLNFTAPAFSFSEPAPRPSFPPLPLPTFDFPTPESYHLVIDGFLLLQTTAWILVDLAGAKARILYENLQNKTKDLQKLMWPLEFEVEEDLLIADLQLMGIECRLIGKKKMAVDALPSDLDPADFHEFIRLWNAGKKMDWAANQYARQGKKEYSLDEGKILWKKLNLCKEKRFDPMGSPIWCEVDRKRLRKIIE